MKHNIKNKKLNKTSSHRKAMFMNMSNSLIKHEQITTTLPKAKEVQKYVERLVTYAKKNNIHGRRLILKKVKGSYKKEIANTLIHEIAPNYDNRSGGYTRIIKLGNRKNDDAKVSILEFVDFKSNEQADSSDDIIKDAEIIEDKK